MMQILDTVGRLTEPALPDDPPHLLGVVKGLIPTASPTASYRLNTVEPLVGRFDVDAQSGEKLFPELDIDPQRNRLPAYNRRTLTLAA